MDLRSRDRRLSGVGSQGEFGRGESFELPFNPISVFQIRGDGPAGAFEQDVAFSSTELRKRGFSKHGAPAPASAGYPPRSG